MSPESLIAPFPTTHELALSFAGVPLRARTNDPDIWAGLVSYYRPYIVPGGEAPVADVRLIQGTVPVAGEFVDLPRAYGKKVKEAVQEVSGGRLILKRTTGVVMGLWEGGAFAAGDVRANLNQAINPVNNCYAKLILRRGFLLLHASAVSRHGGTVELSGRMETLVLLKWRRDGQGVGVRSLAPEDALADLPYFYKNLGAFDPDRPAGSPITNSERVRYGELLGRVRVVEVTGRVDFKALVGLVEQLLS